MKPLFIWLCILFTAISSARAATAGDHFQLANDQVLRELSFDGNVWRTTRFARADGSDALVTVSDEFHVLNLDGSELSLDDYTAAEDPKRDPSAGEVVTISYQPRAGRTLPAVAPQRVVIRYELRKDEAYLRKQVTLVMRQGQVIDRLEVERFSVDQPATRGGRGEPVFVNYAWFFGVEYPAAYSRHTDGNTPKAHAGPYDLFGNYSRIELDGHDVDKHPRPGLIRLMHFPGYARQQLSTNGGSGEWTIVSKTAIAGVGKPGDSIDLAFEDYLHTIRRPVRSFVHYNNWFDADGKRLTADNLVNNIYLPFKRHLEPYGVNVDAIVADDGWQDRKSIYAPNPQQFPNGLADIVALSDALQHAGTNLGLWIALNGYNSDIDWGVAHGYPEAVRNERFKRFKRYYSITDEHYDQTIRQRLTDAVRDGHVNYLKHDFNEMCDLSDHGHLSDDRHGHEASVDEEIGLLALERQLNLQIYQNITNWVWFSPWWLQHGNNLWMLSSDSGDFLGYPEISALLRASVYRDVNLYQVWHDPATRPLVPISHLMTHGIIYTKSKYAGTPGETLRDFGDYVMTYYMRGVQLKEWYISPKILTDDQWKVLGRATRWSQENLQTLANTVYVGGDPRRGEAYGYVAWNGEHGILSVRNPAATEAQITVPFDQTVWYRGPREREYHAKLVYPYQGAVPGTFHPGTPMTFTIPAHTVWVAHLEPAIDGAGGEARATPVPVVVRQAPAHGCEMDLPDESMQRCDLMVTAKYDVGTKPVTGDGPTVRIDDQIAKPARIARGLGWVMLAFDLRDHRAKTARVAIDASGTKGVEGVLIADRAVPMPATDNDPRLPEPLGQGFVRQSVPVFSNDGDVK